MISLPWQIVCLAMLVITVQAYLIYRIKTDTAESLEQVYRTIQRDALTTLKQNHREAMVAYREAYQSGRKHGRKDSDG